MHGGLPFLFSTREVASPIVLSNFLQLIVRRPSTESNRAFVEDVRVATRIPRSARVGKLLLVGWLLIGLKSALLLWAAEKYHVPVDPFWVIVPTIVFALVCTGVYFKGE